ncbi:MAG TPA: YihY/virulence factor BrkB family protein [Actinomycetota bacterium]|nr:YihY/virulence factor BrkB family protein [Actinomycetota bacterium]
MSQSAGRGSAFGAPINPIPTKTGDTGGPDSPLDLTARDYKATARRVFKEFTQDRVTLIAAGMAFYWFLAIFPALIAAVGFIHLAGLGPQVLGSINQSIGTTIPGGAGELLTTAIETATAASRGTSLIAAAIGILLALYSATAGMVALQEGLDVAYDVPQSRKFFKKRAVALLLVVATGVMGGLSGPLFAADGVIWSVLGWLVLIVSVITLLAIYYYVGPNRDQPNWKWVSPGGLLGAFIFLLTSGAFSVYVGNFAKYGETYGPLASVVILLFWLYLTGIAIMLGGEVNAELERQTAMREGRA